MSCKDAGMVIGKYERGELLLEPSLQTSSTADSDTPPTESKEAESE